jgi:hypothetical protein
MLPNWLYGKSKSKLATILGSGGGTPADYDQVKAQVTQNAEDIASLLDNTEVNGAANMLDFTRASQVVKGYTFTNTDGVVTVTGSRASGETGNVDYYVSITLPKGTYKVSGCPSGGSDNTWRLLVNINNGAKYAFDYGDGAEFTLTEESSLRVYCAIMANYSDTVNLTFKPMITVSSYNGDYVPYAKSNRELTEKLTSDTNLGTAVRLSAYTAYSNMFTAPSDGYVHFQSAASGSQIRTIYTYGNNTAAAADSHFTHSTSENNKAFEIYVRKGLKIYADGLQSDDTINFYPLL